MNQETTNKEIIAVIAGEEVTAHQLDQFLQTLPKDRQPYLANPQFREHCKNQFLELLLFAKDGEVEHLEETDAYKELIENARRDILAQLTVQALMENITVTEEEMKAHYEANKMQYQKGESVHAKHILVDEEEKCNDILSQIQNGTITFEVAAAEHSNCPSGSKGGDLGAFGRGQMVKEFEDAAFDAEIGTIVGPVKSQFGYHLIKVEEKNEASQTPYEEAKNMIYGTLLQTKQNDAYTNKAQELREKYLEK